MNWEKNFDKNQKDLSACIWKTLWQRFVTGFKQKKNIFPFDFIFIIVKFFNLCMMLRLHMLAFCLFCLFCEYCIISYMAWHRHHRFGLKIKWFEMKFNGVLCVSLLKVYCVAHCIFYIICINYLFEKILFFFLLFLAAFFKKIK